MEGSRLGYGGTKKKRKAERKGLRTVFYYLFGNCSFLPFSTISSMGVVCKTIPTIHDLPGSAIVIFFTTFHSFIFLFFAPRPCAMFYEAAAATYSFVLPFPFRGSVV